MRGTLSALLFLGFKATVQYRGPPTPRLQVRETITRRAAIMDSLPPPLSLPLSFFQLPSVPSHRFWARFGYGVEWRTGRQWWFGIQRSSGHGEGR
jgi:hypothetical protein